MRRRRRHAARPGARGRCCVTGRGRPGGSAGRARLFQPRRRVTAAGKSRSPGAVEWGEAGGRLRARRPRSSLLPALLARGIGGAGRGAPAAAASRGPVLSHGRLAACFALLRRYRFPHLFPSVLMKYQRVPVPPAPSLK